MLVSRIAFYDDDVLDDFQLISAVGVMKIFSTPSRLISKRLMIVMGKDPIGSFRKCILALRLSGARTARPSRRSSASRMYLWSGLFN